MRSARPHPILPAVIIAALAASSAHAATAVTIDNSYFVNAFVSSPLATYILGDVDNHTSVNQDSQTYFTNGTNVVSAEGYADVDLSTGILHAKSQATLGYDDGYSSLGPFGNAAFGDSFTFLGTFTGQTVTFHATVNGSWTTAGNPAIGPGAANFQMMVLPAGSIDTNAGNILNIFNSSNYIANVLDDVGPTQTFPLQVDIPVTLNGANPSVELAVNLDIAGTATGIGQSFTGDFTHSADLSLTAPAGTVVLSGSGVFPGTAPEPASLSLLLTAAPLFLRRRRH